MTRLYTEQIEYKKSSKDPQTNEVLNSPQGSVNHFRYNPEYFSGANTYVYFNGVLVDEIFNLQFEVAEQVQPIFGYASYTADSIVHGARIIQGAFDIYYRDSGYLFIILNQINKADADKPGAATSEVFDIEHDTEERTIENIVNAMASGDNERFEALSKEFEDTIWGADPDTLSNDAFK